MSEFTSIISQLEENKATSIEDEKEIILKNIDNLAEYLKQTNNELFKLIDCKGDQLSYVIKLLNFNEFGLKISFQIPANFKLNSITIAAYPIKNNQFSEEKLNKLRKNLLKSLSVANQIDDFRENLVKNLFKLCFQYIEQNFSKENVFINKSTCIANSSKSSLNESFNQQSFSIKSTISVQEDEPVEKKPPMKTAGDVKNRIIWDESINKDFISVGYIDRFVGLKECQFNMFDWGDIVLADLNALAIPEHRIQYFKYKNEVIWNKENRLDNVFGSAGSNKTIVDVIEKFKNSEEPITNILNDDIEDLEDEYEQKLGKNKHVKNQISPNYFVSIPVNNAEVKENLFDLRCDLIDSNEHVEHFLLPESSYHLTLFTLRIENETELETIKNLFNEIKTDEEFVKYLPINLNFEGLDEFFNKVLHIKCKSEQMLKLVDLRNYLINRFKKVGINSEAGNYYGFVPHLTIFKVTKSNTTIMRNSCSSSTKFKNLIQPCVNTLVNEHVFKKYSQFDFGKQNFNEIILCKMVNIYERKNYPIEYRFRIDSC